MNKLDLILLAKDSYGYSDGNRYAVIQRTPYVQGTCVDMFPSEDASVEFLKKVLASKSAKSWIPKKEYAAWKRYCEGVNVHCLKCGRDFRSIQKPNNYGYISCTCGAKIKLRLLKK
jgi:DNA-directed RNA polymerase subunit RPC12/RpoP